MATNKASEIKSTSNRPKRKRIVFTFHSPEAHNVALVGDFNNWDYTKTMKKDKDGNWKARLDLEPGRYEYRYLVDGEWQNDPECQKLQTNQFGTQNCILEVSNLQEKR
ncbi:MAG: isoamylase early set domain-containing protein [bacterium]